MTEIIETLRKAHFYVAAYDTPKHNPEQAAVLAEIEDALVRAEAGETVHRKLPIMAMSGDVESDRVLKLHFRRKVTNADRQELVNALNALNALTANPAPQPSGWQPVDTAPTSGNFLIAYSDGSVRAGHYIDNTHTQWPWKGVRPLHGAERPGTRITHWMPLPAAPAAGGDDG